MVLSSCDRIRNRPTVSNSSADGRCRASPRPWRRRPAGRSPAATPAHFRRPAPDALHRWPAAQCARPRRRSARLNRLAGDSVDPHRRNLVCNSQAPRRERTAACRHRLAREILERTDADAAPPVPAMSNLSSRTMGDHRTWRVLSLRPARRRPDGVAALHRFPSACRSR